MQISLLFSDVCADPSAKSTIFAILLSGLVWSLPYRVRSRKPRPWQPSEIIR